MLEMKRKIHSEVEKPLWNKEVGQQIGRLFFARLGIRTAVSVGDNPGMPQGLK